MRGPTPSFWLGFALGAGALAAALVATWVFCVALVRSFPAGSADWVSAIGTILAIVGAAWIARGQSREADRKERRRAAARLVHASRVIYLAYEEIHRAAENFDLGSKRLKSVDVGYAAPETVLNSMAAAERALEDFPVESIDAEPVIKILYFARSMLSAARLDVEKLRGLKPPVHASDYQRTSATLSEAAENILIRYRPVWPIAEPERAAEHAARKEPPSNADA